MIGVGKARGRLGLPGLPSYGLAKSSNTSLRCGDRRPLQFVDKGGLEAGAKHVMTKMDCVL